MTFLGPWALLGLVAVPLLAGVAAMVNSRRRSRLVAAGSALAPTATAVSAARSRRLPTALFLLAIALMIVSLARPEMNVTLPTRTGKVILAFDTSNSMVADDVEPTRIDVAKRLATNFVDRQPNSMQIGVVAFTNGGLVVQDPTKNQRDVVAAIERLGTDGGTSIAEGIFASLTAISEEPIELDPEVIATDIAALDIGYFSNAAIVVFTDGENVGGADPVELAGLAANSGVAVYTVGIGTPRGTVVALDGFSIATALDESMLTAIAESTGGQYFLAADDPELTPIFDAIDRSFERQGELIEVTAGVAMLSMLVLIAAGVISIRRFGRI